MFLLISFSQVVYTRSVVFFWTAVMKIWEVVAMLDKLNGRLLGRSFPRSWKYFSSTKIPADLWKITPRGWQNYCRGEHDHGHLWHQLQWQHWHCWHHLLEHPLAFGSDPQLQLDHQWSWGILCSPAQVTLRSGSATSVKINSARDEAEIHRIPMGLVGIFTDPWMA